MWDLSEQKNKHERILSVLCEFVNIVWSRKHGQGMEDITMVTSQHPYNCIQESPFIQSPHPSNIRT